MAPKAPKNTAYDSIPTYEDVSHQIISSYFIGPQAENLPYFKDNIDIILEELEKARKNYFPEDGRFIDEVTQTTPAFLKSMDKLKRAVQKASNILGRTSIPFWSPRYEAHMCTDMSMASLLGYFMTMLYNPNNVALEASPLSTVAEIEVGEQLCELFGYNIDEDNTEAPTAWGHVTCDGTVANLESIWVGGSLLTSKREAIAGLGSDNVIGIPVDLGARVDLEELEKKLRESLKDEKPVLAVVGIIGSTEEGAVDPISGILALRKQLQAEGLSFVVHADAAWGGYFCSMLPKDYHPGDVINLPTEMGEADGFVPDASLRAQTQEDLFAMRYADSITVDPHKAGYIPYPAGGLCYRDGRMRFLVTWTSPYLSRGSVTSIGIYGVEGRCVPFWTTMEYIAMVVTDVVYLASKPGASAVTNAEIAADDLTRPDDLKAMKLMRELGSDLNINAFSLNFRYEDGQLNDDIEETNYLMQRVVETLSVDSPTDDPTKIPLYLTSTEFSDALYGECKSNFVKRLGLEKSTQDLMVLRNVVMSPFPTDGNFTNNLAKIFYDTVAAETEVVRKRNTLAPDFHNFLIQGTESIYLIHLPMFHVANHRQQLIVSANFDETSKKAYIMMKNSYPSKPMILVTQNKIMLKDVVQNCGKFKGQIMTKESGIILRNIDVVLYQTIVSRPLNSKHRLKDYPRECMPFYLYGNENEAYIDHVITRAPNSQLSAGKCKLEWYENQDPAIWGKPLVLLIEDVREAPMQPLPPNAEIDATPKMLPLKRNDHVKISPEDNQSQQHDGHNNGRHNGNSNEVDTLLHNLFDDHSKIHKKDKSAEPHKAAKIVNSETRSGAAKGSTFFFRPGAQFKFGVWEDGDRSNESSRFASFERGNFVGRGRLTLGDSVYVDSEAMNFDPFGKVEKVSEWRCEFDQIGKELE
ncbi:hypothetical protein GQX73_g2076 [Xylaria multiplex]|uniref:Uncharacterized protein n=1 Tax=Xylaria multiplex TaxID=323545 RepID=A0A7C8NBM7_9PEZI|nr:hypothetical protein GQX73_g2076 [Xylaria multiplex]